MRSAIIGLGVVGCVHLQILAAQKRCVAALCDINKEAMSAAAASYCPNTPIYTDWITMLDEISPDAVHICTPHYLHAEMIITCLDRGIHVLCEKPLCMKPRELSEILAAQERSGAQLAVCQQNRYKPSFRFVKEYLTDKKIRAAHGTLAWSRGEDYYNSAEWRGTTAYEGGGVLINQALHTLDLLRELCGDPEYVVSGKDNLTLRGVIEVEDTLSASFFGKTPFTFFATNTGSMDLPPQIQIVLEDGENVVWMPDTVLAGGVANRFSAEPDRILGKSCYGSEHATLIDDFYTCIQSGRPFPIDGTEAARVMRLIFAAYESGGNKVKI